MDAGKTAKSNGEKKSTGANNRPQAGKEARKAAAEARAALSPLKKKVTALEQQIETLNGKIEQVDEALAAPGLFENDLDKATKLSQRRARLLQKLSETEEAWLALSETYEKAKAASP